MDEVIIATKANGDIMFVTQDLEGAQNRLRNIGHHPKKDGTRSMVWFDFKGDFVCMMTFWQIASF